MLYCQKNMNDIPYSFFFTGPLLFKTKLLPEDIEKIKKLCSKNKKKDFRKELAGILHHEYQIDHNKLQGILNKYLEKHKEAYKLFYDKALIYKGDLMKVTRAWVNYMKKGESNPVHIHSHCIFSSVMFLSIPPNLHQEVKQYKGTTYGPGHLSFEVSSVSEFAIDNIYVRPEVGDFYIFPWNIKHYVVPFASEGERISVAANFKWNENE